MSDGPRVTARGRGRGRVALTFDTEHPSRPDCPPGNADQLIDTLRLHGVRASFFLQGRWATAYPHTARRIAAAGHLVGNHSNHHAPLSMLSDAGIARDVAEAGRRILAVTGIDPRPWFRCPFGDGSDDGRVVSALGSAGYRVVGWDVDGADWEEGRTAAAVEAAVVGGVRRHGHGAIVVLHSWPGPTAGAVPGIIRRLRDEGFEFVAVDELLAAQPNPPRRPRKPSSQEASDGR